MGSIGVLTINDEPENVEDLASIVECAKEYFPVDTWGAISYLGELSLQHDVEIATRGEFFRAFIFDRLIEKVRGLRRPERADDLLLAITRDPIVATYFVFNGKTFKRTSYLVHDYVASGNGVVSLFAVEEDASSKVVAHGLGHNKGLRHHAKPIDLMYSELLQSPSLRVEGFCNKCLGQLADEREDVQQ